MCGPYGHGFIYERKVAELAEPITAYANLDDFDMLRPIEIAYKREKHVMYDFVHNSHHEILQIRNPSSQYTLPQMWKRIGFAPHSLEPLSQDAVLNTEDSLKIESWLNGIFVSRWQIVEWIKNNYGRHQDRGQWDLALPYMLGRSGRERIRMENQCGPDSPYFIFQQKKVYMQVNLSTFQVNLSTFLGLFDMYPNEFWAKKSNDQKELPQVVEMKL